MAGNFIVKKEAHGAALLLVAAAHLLVLWGLLRQRPPLPMPEAATVTVVIVKSRPELPPPKPAPMPPPRVLPEPPATLAPVPPLPVAAPAPSAISSSALEAPPLTLAPGHPAAAQPERPRLGGELAAHCPVRVVPDYPLVSRRLGEEGNLLLQVELDPQGFVETAQVVTSSGHSRLDDAAMRAVRSWRCTPAQRNGQAVRSVAQQPFEFVLQRNRP